MINFKIDRCLGCGEKRELMLSNNPLSTSTLCFSCIKQKLNYQNINQAEFFCRTYNLPWNPDLWIKLSKECGDEVWKQYTSLQLEQKDNQPNLSYTSSTKDLWLRTNKEWEKCRSFAQILEKITPLRESYLDRGHLKWGEQYTFEELIQLESIYSRTLRANNITNPLQKEAVKTLCKIHIEMNEAIRAKDAKAMKDYSASYSTFAKEANLEGMINDTKTEDITTVAELYDYMEKSGFKFKFYDGYDRDEVDRTIKDIQATNRRLILESTGLQPLLEEMANQKKQSQEQQNYQEVTQEEGKTLQELMDFKAEDGEIDTEEDSAATDQDFNSEEE